MFLIGNIKQIMFKAFRFTNIILNPLKLKNGNFFYNYKVEVTNEAPKNLNGLKLSKTRWPYTC